MKYVSNLDIKFWHFDVKIYANLIGLNIIYFQAKFNKERVRANNVVVN